jgi:hypothetical protein
MKIIYNPTRTITTGDLFIACDPPMSFEVKSRLSADWATKHLAWEADGSEDITIALDLVSTGFLAVSQNGERYDLNSIEAAEALREAIEGGNEGEGDTFICDIVSSLAHNHYSFLARNSANSARLSELSNGKNKQKQKAKDS